ncbi:MAG: tetratricopeptide repeat protein [Candidatus Schekmanbacteria bacterium]|nr:tetratricopeptide repeat protein [Candidatus Schekmanbacteria bacterium]
MKRERSRALKWGAWALVAWTAIALEPRGWLGAGVAMAAPSTPAEFLAQGQELYKTGHLEEALAAYEQATVETAPAEVRREAWLQAGVCLIYLGRAAEAPERFRQALAIDPGLQLDSTVFPPEVTDVFAQVRRAAIEEAPEASVVTLTKASVYLSPPEKRPELVALPWYKKWWVWAIAGVALAGAAAAASSGGGGGDGKPYVAPAVNLAITTPAQPGGTYCPGTVDTRITIENGEMPFDVTWYLTIDTGARQVQKNLPDVRTQTVDYQYSGLVSEGRCVPHVLDVNIRDAHEDSAPVTDSALIQVCRC